ncbi:MAG: YlxR family protein [Acidimicrobiia bacterium]|nr:YlxR family protein [Acidimicrobiia bacterium]
MAPRGAGRRRTCIGCRRARPVGELVRFAFVGERLQAGRALPGRGVYLCAGGDDCLRRASAPERLRRAFRRDVPRGVEDDLIAALGPVGHGVSPSARGR